MSQKNKHRAATKMVPVPSQSIVPERDINEIPVLDSNYRIVAPHLHLLPEAADKLESIA